MPVQEKFLTWGEKLAGFVLIAAIGPNEANWPIALPLGLVAFGVWGLRRSNTLRGYVADALDEYEGLPEPLLWLADHITVPPATLDLPALPAPDKVYTPKGTTLEARKDSGTTGLMRLLGDDPRVSKPTPVVTRTSVTAPNVQNLPKAPQTVKPKPQPVEDDAWLKPDKPVQPIVKAQVSKRTPIKTVVTRLNTDADSPHILIVGDSGSGKTTLAQLIAGTRPGKVVILDPKRPRGWEQAKWGGLPYVSRDKRTSGYEPMVQALRQVTKLMDWRYQHQEEATEPFQPITVILDEAKNSVEASPALAAEYRKVVSIGREVNVRLILLSTTDRAGKLGFDGEADSMDSLVWVRLGEFATGVAQTLARPGETKHDWGVVQRAGGWEPFEVGHAYGLVTTKLEVSPDKALPGIVYNCQVAETVPAHPVVQVARPVALAHDQPADDFLAGLFAQESVKRLSLRNPQRSDAEVDGEVTEVNTPAKVTSPTSDARSTNLILREQAAKRIFSAICEASEVDRAKAINALQLMTSGGLKKTPAIAQAFGIRGGEAFQRAVRLVDLYLALREAVKQ